MMFRDDYKALFDSVSPPLTLERQTEREIQEMLQPKARKNVRRTACIAFAAAVLMIGAAIAAVHASGILDRLFLYSEPNETAQQSIIRDSVSVSEEGITLHMDEYLFDNNTLHLGWTVSSERDKPIFYTVGYDYSYTSPDDLTIEEESIGGLYGSSTSGEVGDGVLVRLSEERPEYSGYASYSYCAPLNSTVNARVFIHAYETDFEAIDLSTASFWDLAEDENLSAELENKRQIGLTSGGETSIQSYPAFRAALKRLDEEGVEWDEANERALVESGIFKEIAALELNVAVDPHLAPEPRFQLEGERRFDVSDASVILKQFSIDTASTIIEYEVITDKLFSEDGVSGNGITYLLFDQNGHPLNADCSLSMSAGQINDRDGKHVFLVSQYGNPIPDTVTSITFVPMMPLQRKEESSNSYYLRVRELSSPEQCFTIDLV